MSEPPDESGAPESSLLSQPCVQCGETRVVIVYERFASRVLCCLSCECVWAVDANGDPGDPSGAA